jgi:hypothetical protein
MNIVHRIATRFCIVAALLLIPVAIGKEGLPVIAASVSPVKIRPVEEGGLKIPYQDIIVMNPSLSAALAKTNKVMAPAEKPLPRPFQSLGMEDNFPTR